jgi:hypothetical protein
LFYLPRPLSYVCLPGTIPQYCSGLTESLSNVDNLRCFLGSTILKSLKRLNPLPLIRGLLYSSAQGACSVHRVFWPRRLQWRSTRNRRLDRGIRAPWRPAKTGRFMWLTKITIVCFSSIPTCPAHRPRRRSPPQAIHSPGQPRWLWIRMEISSLAIIRIFSAPGLRGLSSAWRATLSGTGNPAATPIATPSFSPGQPSGLTLNSSGDLFVLSQLAINGTTSAQVMDIPGDSPTTPYLIPSTGLRTRSGMALEPNGNIDVVEQGNGLVTQLDYLNTINLGSAPVLWLCFHD